MKKIKVFHVINSLAVGGMENVLVSLINGMDRDSFDHEVCCISAAGPMQQRLRPGINVHSMGKGSSADRLMPLKIQRLLNQSRPTIVQTYNWGGMDGILAAILAGVGRRGIRLVHAEHGRDSMDPAGTNRKRNFARRCLHPFVSRFIAVSADLDEWMVRQVKIPRGKVLRIINGVDTELFRPGRRVDLRLEIGLCPDHIAIGFVGRLDPVKNIETLIQAVLSLGDPFRLVIVGDGPERAKLEDLAAGSEQVVFLGERQDVSDIYQAFDVFSLASIAEGTPCTIQEAMATGLPIVATGVGGIPSLVDSGNSGFLFAPGDVAEAVSCFRRYQQTPGLIQEHGRNSRKKAVQEFSRESMIDSYQSLYLALAGG